MLERIAGAFHDAGVEIMALKGAALHLTLYQASDHRPMDDLDLMVRPRDADRACAILEACGGLRLESEVREDFFPRFHYEIHYTVGRIDPVTVDLHVRPFRPLRYAQTVSESAFWSEATEVAVGRRRILHPSPEDMLIHLLVHLAVHGTPREVWVNDVRRWIVEFGRRMSPQRIAAKARAWGLAGGIRKGIELVETQGEPCFSPGFHEALRKVRRAPAERLTLWQAPRDHEHPLAHVLVQTICTPGWRFPLSYLWAQLAPDRSYLRDGYSRSHWGWVAVASLTRWLGPLGRWLRRHLGASPGVEVRSSLIHGVGVFATRDFQVGDVAAGYVGRRVDRGGMYVVMPRNSADRGQRYELTGNLKFLNHSCEPNAELNGFDLRAMVPIRAGSEVTIRYAGAHCQCRPESDDELAVRKRAV